MSLRALVPSGVVVACGRVDDPRWPDLVPPAEAALVTDRTATRRTDFVAGRACARLALGGLEAAAPPVIGIGPDRAPGWPSGVVGSITHGAGEVAAAVARRTALVALGVDVEEARPLDPATAAVVASFVEREAAAFVGDLGPTVLVSAKESVYKAWAPDHGWLEHDQVRVLLRPDGTADATVLGADVSLGLAWEVDGAVVRTAAWLPHTSHASHSTALFEAT